MAFDWTPIAGPATGAVIALAGVGFSQLVTYKLKKAELEHQRTEAKIKRVHDSVARYLTNLADLYTTALEIRYKLIRFQTLSVDINELVHILRNKSDPSKLENSLEMYRKIANQINSLTDHDFMFSDLELMSKKQLSDLASTIIVFDDPIERRKELMNLGKQVQNVRTSLHRLSTTSNEMRFTTINAGYIGETEIYTRAPVLAFVELLQSEFYDLDSNLILLITTLDGYMAATSQLATRLIDNPNTKQ